jgi:hypothetical protein
MSVGRIGARAALAAVGGLLSVALMASASWAGPGGNSQAAQACRHGGFKALVGTEGQTFANVHDCVTYAASGGAFASGIIIPKDGTATFTNVKFSACNVLTYGYQLNFGANVPLATKPAECVSDLPEPNVTLGPYRTAVLLRVFVIDETCSFTFYSDGNHGTVSGSNPFTVQIADGEVNCGSTPSMERKGVGNLELTLTVNRDDGQHPEDGDT